MTYPNFQIKHHGAINGVTGSCHELLLDNGVANSSGILIDCGLFQGAEVSADQDPIKALKINFPIEHIKALVVTHVHIDHVGRIPYLLAAGFRGPIICTQASAVLLPLVLEDAVKVGFTRNERLIKQFLKQITKQIIPVSYNQWYEVFDSPDKVKLKLKEAGHILGSAYVEFSIGQNNSKSKRVIFSGDLGPPYTPLLSSPKSPYRADVVVIESTYGDKLHINRRERVQKLKSLIISAFKNRGVLLIPAFSIGRTQELLYEIESIIASSKDEVMIAGQKKMLWQDIEIIVDSPLAAKFTKAYRQLKPFWDKEAKKRLKAKRHPLSFEQLITIDDHKTHLQTVDYLAKTARPAIVLAASGMCTGGRVVNYLKALLEDERHDILFVGYQAQGTPGRDIQVYGSIGGFTHKGHRGVELDGKKFDIKAGVHTISGYSAHADQQDLINFVKRIRHKPKEIRIVHGDKEAKEALKKQYEQLFSAEVIIPNNFVKL
ncbi:MAG: MBL fold metallo-hydrolase [Gammaproteobacteria bacterium]|nr:MBL fold metallo-hydrolase [Gammaproteobacteria bacterium]